jgi:hypothetical protein
LAADEGRMAYQNRLTPEDNPYKEINMLQKILRLIVLAPAGFAMGYAVWSILTSHEFRAAFDLPVWGIALVTAVNALFGLVFAARMLRNNR